MTTKRIASVSCTLLIAVLTILGSCKKDDKAEDTTFVTDNAIVEGESNSVISFINSAADAGQVGIKGDDGQNKLEGEQQLDSLPPCATLIIDTISFPKSITIDFGSSPCQCDDGKYRTGKIIATWNGAYRDSGTMISISTDSNYSAGSDPTALYQFEYLKTVTNKGYNAAGNLHFAVNVITAIVTLPSGQLIVWNSQRDREWIAGESTKWWIFDDVYSITGSATGTDRNGLPFSVNITSPVIVALNCLWGITKGTLDITHGNLPSATLDYGDGSCDNKATITINGQTYEITLN